MASAPDILKRAAQHMEDRAAARDQPGGERSMARTVAAFNALTGHQVSERDGWLFMAVLKMARATNTETGLPDDYEDGAAYIAFAGESVSPSERNPSPESRRVGMAPELGMGYGKLADGFDDACESVWAKARLSALPLPVLTERLKTIQAEFRRRGLAVTLTVEPARDVKPDDGN